MFCDFNLSYSRIYDNSLKNFNNSNGTGEGKMEAKKKLPKRGALTHIIIPPHLKIPWRFYAIPILFFQDYFSYAGYLYVS